MLCLRKNKYHIAAALLTAVLLCPCSENFQPSCVVGNHLSPVLFYGSTEDGERSESGAKISFLDCGYT